MANNITGLTVIGPNQQSGAADDSDDADKEIGRYVSDILALLMTDSDALTITDVDPTWFWTRHALFRITDGSPVPDANGTITVPATPRPVVTFENETQFDQTITISGQGQTPDIIKPGRRVQFSSDGSNIRRINSHLEVPIHFFQHGAPGNSDDIWIQVFTVATTVRDALAGSEGFAKGAPSGGAVVYDILRNNIKIGEVSFADGVSTATFATEASQEYVFAVGDYITFHSPANVQSMTGVSINIAGFTA